MEVEDRKSPGRACSEFISHLREEKLRQQDRRASYIRLKFTFVIGLFSIAAALPSLTPDGGTFYIYGLFYLTPFVAVLFDFYILGGEFAVKRIRAFLHEQDARNDSEKLWDSFLSKKPKEFMGLNRLWVTSSIFFVSIYQVAVRLKMHSVTPIEWSFFGVWVVLIIGLGIYLILIERNIQTVFYDDRLNSDSYAEH